MVWGLISFTGPIALCKVEGKLNSDNYIENILKKYVITNKKIKKRIYYF